MRRQRGYSVEWTLFFFFFGLDKYNTEKTRGVNFKRKMMASVINTVNMKNLKWQTDWKYPSKLTPLLQFAFFFSRTQSVFHSNYFTETRNNQSVSRSVVSDSLRLLRLQPTRFFCPWGFPGKNTRVGCHYLFQRIFSAWGLNLGPLHCRKILYSLSHQGSPQK